MAARTLYLVAYDIAHPRRLRRVAQLLRAYRVAGQKSVPEIWVTDAELHHLTQRLRQLIQPDSDRVQILTLDPRMRPRLLGTAATFTTPHFCVT